MNIYLILLRYSSNIFCLFISLCNSATTLATSSASEHRPFSDVTHDETAHHCSEHVDGHAQTVVVRLAVDREVGEGRTLKLREDLVALLLPVEEDVRPCNTFQSCARARDLTGISTALRGNIVQYVIRVHSCASSHRALVCRCLAVQCLLAVPLPVCAATPAPVRSSE